MYRRAVARGDVAVNPTLRIEKPAVRAKVRVIATPADAAARIAMLAQADRPLWATAFYAGLRRGELIGLRWEDVDLASGVLRVRRGWDAVAGRSLPRAAKGAVKCPSRPSCATTSSSTGCASWREGPHSPASGLSLTVAQTCGRTAASGA